MSKKNKIDKTLWVSAKEMDFEDIPVDYKTRTTWKEEDRIVKKDAIPTYKYYARRAAEYRYMFHFSDTEPKPTLTEEQEAKKQAANKKREETIRKKHSCTDCGTYLGKRNTGLCEDCYDIWELKNSNKLRDLRLKGTYHEEEFQKNCVELKDELQDHDKTLTFTLKREPQNKHDKNAVLVLYKKKPLGYLDKYLAERVSKMLKEKTHKITVKSHGFLNQITEEYTYEDYQGNERITSRYNVYIDVEIKEKG